MTYGVEKEAKNDIYQDPDKTYEELRELPHLSRALRLPKTCPRVLFPKATHPSIHTYTSL